MKRRIHELEMSQIVKERLKCYSIANYYKSPASKSIFLPKLTLSRIHAKENGSL